MGVILVCWVLMTLAPSVGVAREASQYGGVLEVVTDITFLTLLVVMPLGVGVVIGRLLPQRRLGRLPWSAVLFLALWYLLPFWPHSVARDASLWEGLPLLRLVAISGWYGIFAWGDWVGGLWREQSGQTRDHTSDDKGEGRKQSG